MDSDDSSERQESVRQLASLTIEPEAGFAHRVRNQIHRRLFAGELTDFSFSAFAHAILEYVQALFGLLGSTGDEGKRR